VSARIRRILRASGKTASLAAAEPAGDGLLFLFDAGLRFIRVLLLLAIWRSVLSGRPPTAGMTMAAVLTYTLLGEVFAEQLNIRTRLSEHLWNGSIANRFLWPMGFVSQFLAESVGRWTLGFVLCSIPLLLAAPLLGVDPRPAHPSGLPLFALSLCLAVSVGLAADFAFAILTVRLQTTVWLIERVRTAVTTLLSGAMLPLALLPWSLGEVFGWLPFAAMASAPLRVYTGSGPVPALLASQLAWSIVLWPLVWWLWRRSQEKVVGYGG
jgi:ABC-2 type transport system permease protein